MKEWPENIESLVRHISSWNVPIHSCSSSTLGWYHMPPMLRRSSGDRAVSNSEGHRFSHLKAHPQNSDFEAIKEIFSLEDSEDINAFVMRRPGLIGLLTETHDRITGLYGKTQCVLSMLSVPEDSSPKELVLTIPTTLPVDEAMALLHELEESWWFDQPMELTNGIIIDLQYIVV